MFYSSESSTFGEACKGLLAIDTKHPLSILGPKESRIHIWKISKISKKNVDKRFVSNTFW